MLLQIIMNLYFPLDYLNLAFKIIFKIHLLYLIMPKNIKFIMYIMITFSIISIYLLYILN